MQLSVMTIQDPALHCAVLVPPGHTIVEVAPSCPCPYMLLVQVGA